MKKWILVAALSLSSFFGHALELSTLSLQGYMKALPAISDWANQQPALQNSDALKGLLGEPQSADTGDGGLLSLLKQNDLYSQFSDLLAGYGFTPEQLLAVGGAVSSAYLANLKGGLSEENQQKADKMLGGLQSMTGKSSTGNSMGMLGSLANSAGSADTPKVSDNNLALVKEYLPQLQQLYAKLAN